MSFYDCYAECSRRKKIAPASQMAADCLGCTKANIAALAKKFHDAERGRDCRGGRMLDVSADYMLG